MVVGFGTMVKMAALLLISAHSSAFVGHSPFTATRGVLPARSSCSSRSSSASNIRCATTAGTFLDRFLGNKGGIVNKKRTTQQSQPLTVRKDDKVGILFLNLGGPEKLSEVEDFLFNLFNDPDIIRLPSALKPLQPLIARGVARRRAPDSRHNYESIGGGSPICKLTQEQADRLEEELQRRGIQSKVYIGMRYWYPFTEEAVDKLLSDGVNRLVILPLYPQYSISTTGSSVRLLSQIMRSDPKRWDPRRVDHTVVPDFYNHPGYLAAQAKLIAEQLKGFSDRPDDVKVLFSAHGVPESYVLAGDPYKKQIEECSRLIMEELHRTAPPKAAGKRYDWVLSFQSRVGPVQWLKPYTDVVLQELGQSGLKNLVVVPLSFVSEHVETLEEIDQEYREIAEEAGISNFMRVPALNSDPLFIDTLADLTVSALTKPALRVSECLNMYQDENNNLPGYPWELGITRAAEQWNGRVAMLGIATLAVSQVLNVGCPSIDGPNIAGKEPFCAAFSYAGWAWLPSLLSSLNVH